MRVVFIGPPGCGKGTQAQLVRQRMGLAYIGTGEILRDMARQATDLGKQVKPRLDAGLLVPDEMVNAVVEEHFRRPDHPNDFILDGYPRTQAQAKTLDRILKEAALPLQAVIFFQIDEDEAVRRMLLRKRADDSEETVRNRLRVYKETIPDLLGYYRKKGLVHEVQAGDSIESVYERIALILQNPRV